MPTQVFLNAQKDVSANLLTVVKIDDLSDLDKAGTGKNNHPEYTRPSSAGKMSYLFDANNNKYALIRPKDITIMPDDLLLMNDIIVVYGNCHNFDIILDQCSRF